MRKQKRQTPLTFEKSTYLSQLFQMRDLAGQAIKRFPIEIDKIEFINHAENTTYKVTSTKGHKYLLRINRLGNHTLDAHQEELKWLAQLKRKNILAPRPVLSKKGRLIEQVSSDRFELSRLASLFEWTEGRFIDSTVNEEKMRALGEFIGELQSSSVNIQVKHRRYWSAEGLLGKNAHFGSIEKIGGISKKDQTRLSQLRRLVLGKLKNFERKFPERMGLIHADLHFGNVLWLKDKRFAAIDFDDCGYGFHAYDLVMPIISMEGAMGKKRKAKWPLLQKALIDGYSSKATWTPEDEKILPHLINARSLLMLGWLQARSDNPKLAAILKPRVKRVIKRLTKEYLL